MEFCKSVKVIAVVAALGLAICVPASAATLNLQLVYDQSLLSDFTPAPYSLADHPELADASDYHQFSIYFTLDGATTSPDESVQTILWDVQLGPGLTSFGYAPNTTNPQFDPPPPGPLGGSSRPLWSQNGEGDTDLQRLAFITDELAAHGLDPGESSQFYLGDFYLGWDTVAPGHVQLAPAATAPADPWSLWLEGGSAEIEGPDSVTGESFDWGQVVNTPPTPEPDSSDALLYGQTVFTHTFTAEDTEDGNTAPPLAWSLDSGPGSIDAAGNWSWAVPSGTPEGHYLVTARVTDTGGLSATTTRDLLVPEPASIALAGLALIGLVGYGRRRS